MSAEAAMRQVVAEVEAVTSGRVVVVAGGLVLMMGREVVAGVQRTEDHVGDVRRLGTGWCAFVVGMYVASHTEGC